MSYSDIEDTRMYKRAEQIADDVWDIVANFEDRFVKDTIGMQLVRSADSIGANIAEGGGRYHAKDVIRFLHFSRGSLRETRYWLKRLVKREIISQEQSDPVIDSLRQLNAEINGYIKFQRTRIIKEPEAEYVVGKPSS